jgi:hypothetical protein
MTLLLVHIALAFASILVAAANYSAPSHIKFRVSYGLIGGTLASGVILTAGAPSHVVESTVSGIIYLAIVSVATVAAARKSAVTD